MGVVFNVEWRVGVQQAEKSSNQRNDRQLKRQRGTFAGRDWLETASGNVVQKVGFPSAGAFQYDA